MPWRAVPELEKTRDNIVFVIKHIKNNFRNLFKIDRIAILIIKNKTERKLKMST